VIFTAIAGWAVEHAYPVRFMCEQLNVSTSGYYKWRNTPESARSVANRDLTVLITAISAWCNRPGVRRMRAEPRRRGRYVGPVRLWRLMRDAGLLGRHPTRRKQTTRPGRHPVDAPDLIGRKFYADGPNQKWCGDVTYIKTWEGWAYLATVIDLWSRKLVGWAIADNMETSLVVAALDMALRERRPPAGVIFHSDRGSQYTSAQFVDYCPAHAVTRSLGRTGSCFDNAVSESFNATYKKELIHLRPWPTINSLTKATFEWVETQYNRRRRHSYLNYLTIEEFELGYTNIEQLVA
jgi:transposase InsO family protein